MTSITVIAFLLFELFSQGHGVPIAGSYWSSSAASASASASASSSSSAVVATNNGVAIQPSQAVVQLRGTQSHLQQLFSQQTTFYQQNQASLQQLSSSGNPLPGFFQNKLAISQGYLNQAQQFLSGAESMVAILEGLGGDGVRVEWLTQVITIQELCGFAIQRLAESNSSVQRAASIVGTETQAFNEAKSIQLTETRDTMEEILRQLEAGTREVGLEAKGILEQFLNEITVAVRGNVPAGQSEAILAGIRQDMAATLSDLQDLRPENVEIAMADAHHSMDEIYNKLMRARLPSNVGRKMTSTYKNRLFACMTKAQNLHSAIIDGMQSYDD